MPPHDGWSLREIRQRCQDIKAVLAEEPTFVTEAELTDYWPGGAENKLTGRGAWIYCYAQYSRFFGRLTATDTEHNAIREVAEQAARDALRGAPERVELDQRDEFGIPKTLTVFPKSFHAICVMEGYDGLLLRLSVTFDDLKQRSEALFASHAEDLIERMTYYHRLIVFILSHPEPGLPFADTVSQPEIPPWTMDLSPMDLFRIIQAHRVVNGGRIQVAMKLLEPVDQATQQRPGSWTTLLAVASKDLSVSSRTLARDYTLESIVAQLALAREAERQAQRENAPKPKAPALDLADGVL